MVTGGYYRNLPKTYCGISSLFIDDLARKHESHPPYTILYHDVIRELDQKGVNYIRFKGDWQEVLEELGL